uniref:Glutamine-dependent NAD(+) synthetase n=1 Tax=Chrysotila carterae TaxID=13221 RepID=A0A7S4C0W7_CHRCT
MSAKRSRRDETDDAAAIDSAARLTFARPKLFTVATCSLNQWSLDFVGNLKRVSLSIQQAKEKGATFRTGPELELSGYGCEDHFLEQDTVLHCWQSLASLLDGDLTDGILCDVGMPVLHKNVRYNCRVFLLNRKVLLIRPKLCLCDDGNYRESRWFTEWDPTRGLEEHSLPGMIVAVTGQQSIPFGIAAIPTADTVVGTETCEELFTPKSPHIAMSLDGVEIIANGSGSHHRLRMLDQRLDLLRGATQKSGGLYLYANQRGCDGGRLYYDGCALIALNGKVLAQGEQFALGDVEVITASVDLEHVRSYRGAVPSRSRQAASAPAYPRVAGAANFAIGTDAIAPAGANTQKRARLMSESKPISLRLHTPEEEISFGPSCYLWDYLRRSGANGYFLPLSGGADSSSTAALVGIMCQQVAAAARAGNEQVISDARRIAGQGADWKPTDDKEFCKLIMHTSFMGTKNSSTETRDRAALLAKEIGAYHAPGIIDPMIEAILKVFKIFTGGEEPKYLKQGGSHAEDVALQNIQARSRMVLSYLLAQLLPWVRGKKGFLLVLGSANVDEALRGYMTKYDCSSADINPIGGISKGDLKRFLLFAADRFNLPSLKAVVLAKPTAELRPLLGNEIEQTDEEDMGMTYEELGIYGKLRKVERCGPVSMFTQLLAMWNGVYSASEISAKVKHFFSSYGRNRHKLTTLTPAYHAEGYSPDDNRFDLRQFLYPSWSRQFDTMDKLAAQADAK